MATVSKGRPSRSGGMADHRAELQALANELAVPPAVLATLYETQLVATALAASDLLGRLERNLDRIATLPMEHPQWREGWARWYRQEVQFEYEWRTLELLLCRGHALVCGNHGPMHADFDVLSHARSPEMAVERAWEALSAFGAVEGGDGATAWSRWCWACAESGQAHIANERLTRDEALKRLGAQRRGAVA